MGPSETLTFRLWSLGFRALSLGVLVLGALAALVGAITVALAFFPRAASIPGVSFGRGVFFMIVGVLFVVIGARGIRIRTRDDIVADFEQTASDRDRLERWINR